MSGMTQRQGELLSQLIEALRPSWGAAGTAKALYEARDQGDAFSLSIAAIRAAEDEGNRTPAIIGLNGAHWQGLRHKTPKVDKAELCDVCGRPQPTCERVRFAGDDHAYRPSGQA